MTQRFDFTLIMLDVKRQYDAAMNAMISQSSSSTHDSVNSSENVVQNTIVVRRKSLSDNDYELERILLY